jgi:hypothetical protein
MYFQQYGPVRFWVCFGFVLSAGAILKDFSALFLGLFGFVFSSRFFVFNNLSGSFFKITSFSVPFVSKSQTASLFAPGYAPRRTCERYPAPEPSSTIIRLSY